MEKIDILFLLKRIDMCMHLSFDAVVAKYDLTDIQGHVLMYIMKCNVDKINQTDIANKYGVKKSTISGIISRLENNGYIIRKPDPNDSRCNNLVLTDKAYSVQKALDDNRNRMTDEILKGFSDEEFSGFVNSLNKIYDNIKEFGGNDYAHCKNSVEKR